MELRTVKLDLIDPNPDQPRLTLRTIEELAKEITAVGYIIHPPLLIEAGDRFTTIAGHRRIEAWKLLGNTEIVVLVREGLDKAAQISAIMAENTSRDDLSAIEKARGYQTMFATGVEKKKAARIVGLDEMPKASTIATLVDASEKVANDSYVFEATLDEAAGLMEFEADPEAYSSLLGNVGRGFAHDLERRRQNRDRAEKRAASRAELRAAGTKIHTESQRNWSWATLKEAKTTAEAHASCPGHIAVVGYSGDIDYYCTKPAEHGLGTSRTGEVKDKAAEKAKRENRAAHRAATAVRLRFLSGLLLTKRDKADSAIVLWALAYTWSHGVFAGPQSCKVLDEIGLAAGSKPTSPLNGVVALAIAAMEKRLADHNKFDAMVHALADGGDAPLDVITYFDALTHNLYDLAECEDSFIDACLAKRADKSTKRIDVGTPLTAERCAAIANPTDHAHISAEAFVDAIEPFLDEIGVPRDDGTDECENTDATPLVEEGAHEGEIRTPSTNVVNLADAVAQAEESWTTPEVGGNIIALSSPDLSRLWKRALDEGTAKLNTKGVGAEHWDIHLTLTIADVSTEAATVRFIVAGTPGKFPTDAIAIANKLAIVGGCTFDAPTQGLGGLWSFEALLEAAGADADIAESTVIPNQVACYRSSKACKYGTADQLSDCDFSCPGGISPYPHWLLANDQPAEVGGIEPIQGDTENPFADARISKEFASDDADRMLVAVSEPYTTAPCMHWHGEIVYSVEKRMDLDCTPKLRFVDFTFNARRPVGAALTDARLFATRYAEAHNLKSTMIEPDDSNTITLTFVAVV